MSSPSCAHIAIITGAAQGIGCSIALRLADDGIDIAVNDLPTKTALLEEVAVEIRAKGRRCVVIPGDVAKEGDVKEVVEATVRELGGLDIVSVTPFY